MGGGITRRQGGGRQGRARASAALATVLFCALGAGCDGPGFEPPWADRGQMASANDAVTPGTGPGIASAGTGGGAFGNNTGAAGTGVVVPPPADSMGGVVPTESTPSGAGGAGMPTSGSFAGSAATDPGSPAASVDAGTPLQTIDFVPGCDTEAPLALEPEAGASCRYALPDASLDPMQLNVARLDGETPTLLTYRPSALECLLGGGYYLDLTTMPATIVVCSTSCSALAPDTQLIAIAGCQ